MRRYLLPVLMIAITAFVMPSTALAQVFEGCADINGVPVASVPNNNINDIAQASYIGVSPVIFYNTDVLAQVAPQTRVFFYAHECGHHALGHVLSGMRLGQEQEADCFGIRALVNAGVLSDDDITVVQNDIFRFGRGDWSHLPGPQRAINLRACLGDAGSGSDGSSDPSDHSEQDEAISTCISEHQESCMDDCTGNYGYSEEVCEARLCNPDVGANRAWTRQCRRENEDN